MLNYKWCILLDAVEIIALNDATELDDFIDSGIEVHRTGGVGRDNIKGAIAMSFEFAPRHNK